ncbi:COP9 signalosome complex subunit 1 [Ceratocystis fimbriata CBS 114723]|uniref:COP9 signalosome complex subunit 1 n=1 Tax=Ceratocystis fimbriata CBS 114723 TaxID=1035309 RepID=A0A2C5WU66_9PEZI|nr:COP9 signalosome complex subunit 1 [Ceratocystis fimbriata CBS 114723]
MASSELVSVFFDELRQEGRPVVDGPGNIELESYLANYEGTSIFHSFGAVDKITGRYPLHMPTKIPKLTLYGICHDKNLGRTRYERLHFIGCTSVSLCIPALKLAVAEAKNGSDVLLYKNAVKTLAKVAPNDPDATEDADWVSTTIAAVTEETARLQKELKLHRRNMNQESIRLTYLFLGTHYERIGKSTLALEQFSLCRPESVTPKQLLSVHAMCVRVGFYMRDWHVAMSHISKMAGIAATIENLNNDEEAAIHVCMGLTHMNRGEYQESANAFLHVGLATQNSPYSGYASPNDIAVYGSLLSLAMMDREMLQEKVLGNPQFRSFLGIEPNLRKAIVAFVAGRYGLCLSILEDCRPDYLLDLYLSKHVNILYGKIRTKCIREYCRPFSKITIKSLQSVFGERDKSIIDELKTLIRQGHLQARINTIDGLVTSQPKSTTTDVLYLTAVRAMRFEDNLRNALRLIGLNIAELEPMLAASGTSEMDQVTKDSLRACFMGKKLGEGTNSHFDVRSSNRSAALGLGDVTESDGPSNRLGSQNMAVTLATLSASDTATSLATATAPVSDEDVKMSD